jgi:hypothetical protein
LNTLQQFYSLIITSCIMLYTNLTVWETRVLQSRQTYKTAFLFSKYVLSFLYFSVLLLPVPELLSFPQWHIVIILVRNIYVTFAFTYTIRFVKRQIPWSRSINYLTGYALVKTILQLLLWSVLSKLISECCEIYLLITLQFSEIQNILKGGTVLLMSEYL